MIDKSENFDILISDFDEHYFKVDFPGRFNQKMLENTIELEPVIRAKKKERIPVVFSRAELLVRWIICNFMS